MANPPRKDPLKHRPSEDEQVDVLFALKSAPDHALAITAAAYVDFAVEMTLKDHLRIDKDESSRIFDGAANAILGTASAKITMAYAVRAIEKQSRDDLRKMNKVRNIFAHTMHKIDFKHPEVAAICRTLSLIERRSDMFPDAAKADPRTVYWNTCLDYFVAYQFNRRGIQEDGTVRPVGPEN